MAQKENKKRYMPLVALILCNILLMVLVIGFTVLSSSEARSDQEQLLLNNFCTTVETMKRISSRYLDGEYDTVEQWAAYIQRRHMTMDEAMDYIRTISSQDNIEAHFVDTDTFEAWSTLWVDGSNSIARYAEYLSSDDPLLQGFVERMRAMINGEKCILGKYVVRESQKIVISVGTPVPLRQPDGTDKTYLLLRVIPAERMKELWLFPLSYSSAEIGLINTNCDCVIPSYSMRSENFMEFVRSYNFPNDYSGADRLLSQLKEQPSGLLKLNDSKGRLCYWYYSALDEFEGLDILGYIPVSELSVKAEGLSITLLVAGALLLLALIDGIYILGVNRRLRQTADVAEKASLAKTQFLSTMSHDIRTPLNAVLGMTELAQKHIDNTDYVQGCLKKISISGRHLLTLINDILEISRVESGKIVVNPVPFRVEELVASLEDITHSQAAGRQQEFEIHIKDLPEPCLLGDKLRLTQIYLNLLNNAVKYTPPGGKITFEMEEVPHGKNIDLVCVVKDTGIGMSPEFMHTMYESFTRVADSRIDKIQGSGLGLSIVKHMVDLMGGTIDCVSTVGVGTAFTVCIPLQPAPACPLEAPETDTASAALDMLPGLRALIAEDNELNWEIISQLLSERGVVCQRAENGRICVDMLTSAPPNTFDLVFMDIQMPVLNGRDAARALRASTRKDLQDIPIIAMTADAFAEDVQLCLDAGMDAHVAKPVDIEIVVTTVRRVLSSKGSSAVK